MSDLEGNVISKRRGYWLLLVFLWSAPIMAQTRKDPAVSKVFAILEKSVDLKSAAVGDEVVLTTLNDVVVDDSVVIPKGSKLVGHIGGVVIKGKDEPKSVLAIRIDKAVTAGAHEIPLQAIIAAIAAPPSALTSDPTYTMMHSNEPKMVGSAQGASSSGTLTPSSKASSTAAVATAAIKGRMDEPFLLNEDSQGAAGYEDVSMAWHLTMPPPLTVFATKAKNLKLEAGTQMLIRMAEPRLPK